MRYDADHKQRTRQRVLREAAAAIRANGPQGIGVAGLMAKAGLTHGGFYAHFKSKDDLVTQAVEHMFEDSREVWRLGTEGRDVASGLVRFVDAYLSSRHRDMPERGCPMPSLAGEVARMPADARERFSAGVERVVDAITNSLTELGRPDPRRLAESAVGEMVGALAIARALNDPERSQSMLTSARHAVKQRFGLLENAPA